MFSRGLFKPIPLAFLVDFLNFVNFGILVVSTMLPCTTIASHLNDFK